MPTRIRKDDGTYLDADDVAGQAAAVADLGAKTAADLTDNTAGTANTTLEAIADLDTSDTYTDAALNAKLASIRNNLADLAAMVDKLTVDTTADRAKVNDLLAKLRTSGALTE